MRLVLKHPDGTKKVFSFTAGPVYIGRHTNSQVFLPDKRVSRHHAVIFSTPEGNWILEDLDSANRTCLNNAIVHKACLKTGDRLGIVDFTIEIDLEKQTEPDKNIQLEDTLVGAEREPQIIVRTIDASESVDITLPAKRIIDFARATELICEADNLAEMIEALLGIAAGQLNAFHAFCALRSTPVGPMTSFTGRARDGRTLQLDQIKLKSRIAEAVEKSRFMLLPRLPDRQQDRIQSAMIAPVKGSAGCFGVLYVDNSTDDEPYNVSDLDYTVLLAVHTATILKNF